MRTRILEVSQRQQQNAMLGLCRVVAGVLMCLTTQAHALQRVVLPAPHDSVEFGARTELLANGWIVVADPGAPSPYGAPNAGAVHLFRPTGERAATIRGSAAGQRVGADVVIEVPIRTIVQRSIVALGPDSFAIHSPFWGTPGVSNAGAITHVTTTDARDMVIGPENSLIGSNADDQVGRGDIVRRPDGGLVVRSPAWDNGTNANVGAITMFAPGQRFVGVVSAANSHIGRYPGDQLGSVAPMWPRGRMLVLCPACSSPSAAGSGMVAVVDPGLVGQIDVGSSLFGATAGDALGASTQLIDGNVVIHSPRVDRGTEPDVGAWTFIDPDDPPSGLLSERNSLVGENTDDFGEESVLLPLPGGGYVIAAPTWDRGSIEDAGAVVFGRAGIGARGVVSSSNALVGATAGDRVGTRIAVLATGNYVVGSPFWTHGGVGSAGAATFGTGDTGIQGEISAANSLVGSNPSDLVGNRLVTLSNGNYVVASATWNRGDVADAGAVTFADGTTGVTGPVSEANSLVGQSDGDRVGTTMLALPNGNYVVGSQYWNNGPLIEAGFAMLVSGQTGAMGPVNPQQALVGGASYDGIGRTLRLLSDGNWLAISITWGTPGAPSRGAVTWGHSSIPITGTVSPLNSLVGLTAFDRVGWSTGGLADGSYLVQSPFHDPDGLVDAGAVTYGAAGAAVRGIVSLQNSILGSVPNGGFSLLGLPLQASDYVVAHFGWRNALGETVGAVVFPDSEPPTGLIIDNRPLIGRSIDDTVVGAEAATLRSGHRLSVSALADSSAGADAGRVTVTHPDELPTAVSATNSVYGAAAGGGSQLTYLIDQTRNQIIVTDRRGEQITLVRPGSPTTTTLSIDGGKPFLPGVPVVFVVTVAAQATPPTGPALVMLGNGQSCSDATPTAVTPVVARYACAVVSSTAGDIPVWAEFPGTREHAYSGTPAQQLTVLPATIFDSGFEPGAVPDGM